MRVMHAAVLALVARSAGAQSLAQRVTSADGLVDVVYASRPSACGDGRSYIAGVFGDHSTYEMDGWRAMRGPCVHGPAHVVATVISGEVTRLHAYVGPYAASADTRTISATPIDAAGWLERLVASARTSVASQAMLPLVLVDDSEPLHALLRVAQSDDHSLEIRRSALMWLSSAITERLGLDVDESSDDAQLRTQAVYSLAQRRSSESVPTLIDLARTSKHPEVRKAAIYWAGQTVDARAVNLYAELLGLR